MIIRSSYTPYSIYFNGDYRGESNTGGPGKYLLSLTLNSAPSFLRKAETGVVNITPAKITYGKTYVYCSFPKLGDPNIINPNILGTPREIPSNLGKPPICYSICGPLRWRLSEEMERRPSSDTLSRGVQGKVARSFSLWKRWNASSMSVCKANIDGLGKHDAPRC